ncbi:hypothetical protein [Sessilibacter sp. MAH4]
MSTINYTQSLKIRINQVDNRLTMVLNADNPVGEGGKFFQVCDMIANGVGYGGGSSDTIIDITGITRTIQGSIGNAPVPLSVVGANYQGGGGVSVTIIADNEEVQTIGNNLNAWQSEQWMVYLKAN